jgi:hypothetical protein
VTREVLDNQLATTVALLDQASGECDPTLVVGYIQRAMACLQRAAQEADFQAEQADRLTATGQEVKANG